MPPVLNEKRHWDKGLVAVFLLSLAAQARAESAEAGLAPRPFLASTLEAAGRVGTSPLRLGVADLAWLVPSGTALALALENDVSWYQSLAKGGARRDWLDHSMPAVSALGDGLTEFSAAALMNRFGDERMARTSALAMQGLVVTGIWGEAFKLAAWSNRPYVDDSAHRFWDFGQDSTGFPSGHTASAFCAAEIFGGEYGRWLTYPFAMLVAYSRVYNQDHWPSDLVAGGILGVVTAVQVRRLAQEKGPPGIRFSFGGQSGTPLLAAHVHF